MNKETLLIKLIEMIIDEKPEIQEQAKSSGSDLIGKPVIVRCRDAGVHFGYYVSHNGREVVLSRSRRMWRWWAKKQMTLSAVAEFGLNETKSELRIQCELSENIILLDACEIISCTKDCVESFNRVDPHDEQ